MRRVLVTAVSGDIANGILHILREKGDDYLVGTDVNEYAVGMDQVDAFQRCRYAVEDGYVDEMLDLCRTHQITHLIPANEREIEVLSAARDRFLRIGVKMLVQSESVLAICLDKRNTADFLQASGVKVPRVYVSGLDDPHSETGWIVKPRKSNGSRGIRRLPVAEPVAEDEIVQAYIPGDEYTVGVFSDGNICNVICFKRQLKNGLSYLVELEDDTTIADVAKKVAESLKLRGYVNIQLRKFAGENYVFEINPRISGTLRFRHMLGFSDVLWWLDYLDGQPVSPYSCEYRKAVGIRELSDKYLVLERK